MRLLLMCASEVSEGVEVMEGGRRKSDGEEEEEEKGRMNSSHISGSEIKFVFGLFHCQTTGAMRQRK